MNGWITYRAAGNEGQEVFFSVNPAWDNDRIWEEARSVMKCAYGHRNVIAWAKV